MKFIKYPIILMFIILYLWFYILILMFLFRYGFNEYMAVIFSIAAGLMVGPFVQILYKKLKKNDEKDM